MHDSGEFTYVKRMRTEYYCDIYGYDNEYRGSTSMFNSERDSEVQAEATVRMLQGLPPIPDHNDVKSALEALERFMLRADTPDTPNNNNLDPGRYTF
jgi:hypothetical protein